MKLIYFFFSFGNGTGSSSWAGIEEVQTGSCDLSSSKSIFTSKSGRDLSLFIISLYSRSSKSLFKSISDRFRDLNRFFRSKSDCEVDGLGIRDLLEPKGVTLVREDEGVTLVREDEGDGVVGVVILVGEGDGGVGGGDRDEVGEGDGGGGPCEPRGITNPAGIFILPAKLSLISFNNFITPFSLSNPSLNALPNGENSNLALSSAFGL